MEFLLAVVSCRGDTQCVGNVHNVSSTRVAAHTFYFETRPSPLSKIGENAFGAHFLQFYRKNEYGDPHFLFPDFNKDSASFR